MFQSEESNTVVSSSDEQLDEIDAEFASDKRGNFEVVILDGIQMAVEDEQDKEFEEEELDYEDEETETIYPVEEDDEVMVLGEENLNTSQSSSTIISFKPNNNQEQSIRPDYMQFLEPEPTKQIRPKSVEEMTPEELIEANPMLREWMGNLLKTKGQVKEDGHNKAGNETKAGPTKDQWIVSKRDSGKPPGERCQTSPVEKDNIDKIVSKVNLIRLPSDMTIYAPALKLTPTKIPTSNLAVANKKDKIEQTKVNETSNDDISTMEIEPLGRDSNFMNKITQFVEQIREQTAKGVGQTGRLDETEIPLI